MLMAATGIVTLAACSGSGDPASATEAAPAQQTSTPVPTAQALGQAAGGGGGGFAQLDETQVAALAACLVGRGFEIPDGATNLQTLFGGSPPSAELQEALNDCATEVGVALPSGFGGGGGGQ